MWPRLTIDLAKITYNAAKITEKLATFGGVTYGVTKVCAGLPEVAQAMLAGGVDGLADSRLQNIKRMRDAGIVAPVLLLRSPSLSEIQEVVSLTDISLNSDPIVLATLSREASKCNIVHKVILMVDLGDGREGVMPEELTKFYDYATKLPNLEVVGIGTNLACLSGVVPTLADMRNLAQLNRQLPVSNRWVSGGTSGVLPLVYQSDLTTSWVEINHWRIGESIFFGWDIMSHNPLPGLQTNACILEAEVIEVHQERIVVALGVAELGNGQVYPLEQGIKVMGVSSDHLVAKAEHAHKIQVGDVLCFGLDYSSLLAAASSIFVNRRLLVSSLM